MYIKGEKFYVQALYRDLIRVTFNRYLDIQCFDGVFWITQDGSCADIVIEAGDSVKLTCPGLVMMQALTAGHVCFVEST